MKRKLLSIIIVTLLFVCIVIPLAGCTPRNKTLKILSQSEYIDEDIFKDFKKQNPGVKVEFDIELTNEDIYKKIANNKRDYDLICVSDYLIEQMIREELLLQPDFSEFDNIGNISPFIWDRLGEISNIDKYVVPYMWGTMGILYNVDNVDVADLDSLGWNIFWSDAYMGKSVLKESLRDSYFAASMALDPTANPNSTANLTAIENKLKSNKGVGKTFYAKVDEDRDVMVNGEKDVCLQWAGDAIYAMELALEETNGPELYYHMPEKANLFVDCYAIPQYAANKPLAEKFMDFLCDEEIAMANMEYIGYTSCVATPGMFEMLEEYFVEYYDGELGLVDSFGLTPIDVSYFFRNDSAKGIEHDYSGLNLTQATLLWIQYPEKSKLDTCVMMRDFGSTAEITKVQEMWARWLVA